MEEVKKKLPNRKYAKPQKVTNQEDERYQWQTVGFKKLPYASHVNQNLSTISEKRLKRIRKVMYHYSHGKSAKDIADMMGINQVLVKRDLTTAVVLTGKNMKYVPKLERKIMEYTTGYTKKAEELFVRVEKLVTQLENESAHLDAKKAIPFVMMLGELRQTLELGAKLTGELQSGTRINVVMFSGLIKKIIGILESELPREQFARIRDRIKLEMQGQEPLGSKGGAIEIDENTVIDGEIVSQE
jgi:hypothetical protein